MLRAQFGTFLHVLLRKGHVFDTLFVMKKIVEATYPSSNFKDEVQEMNCEKQLSNGEELACKWQKVVQVKCPRWRQCILK